MLPTILQARNPVLVPNISPQKFKGGQLGEKYRPILNEVLPLCPVQYNYQSMHVRLLSTVGHFKRNLPVPT